MSHHNSCKLMDWHLPELFGWHPWKILDWHPPDILGLTSPENFWIDIPRNFWIDIPRKLLDCHTPETFGLTSPGNYQLLLLSRRSAEHHLQHHAQRVYRPLHCLGLWQASQVPWGSAHQQVQTMSKIFRIYNKNSKTIIMLQKGLLWRILHGCQVRSISRLS